MIMKLNLRKYKYRKCYLIILHNRFATIIYYTLQEKNGKLQTKKVSNNYSNNKFKINY